MTVPPVVKQPPAEDVPAAEEPSGEPAVTGWLYTLPILWLVGVAGMLAYGTVSYLMLRRRVYDAVCGEDGVWEHHALRSPFILGLFRPGTYLPMGITGQARQFILQHERAHLRRWDHVVKPVCWAALAVHWFNPFAWAAFLLMSRDIETACDESVIRRLGEEVKADYSDTLLELAVSKRFPSPSPLSFGEGDAKTRIKHVLNFKKPAQWVSVVAAVVAVAAALCLLTDRGDSYTRYEAYPEGLGFRVEADERTGVTTTRAYRLDGREPVLVGGWVYYPANNFTGLIHPDGNEEPLLGGPWNVRAKYGQMVVDAARELDPEWADSLLELKWDEKEGLQPHSAMSHPSGETYFMSFLTQENDLLIYLNGDLFVFPLTTFPVPEGVGAVLQDIDGDGVKELYISHTWASGTGVAVDRLLVCEPNGGELNYWIHDWEPLTGDFNANRAASYDEETGHVTVTYKGVTITANPGLLLPADIYDNPAAITGEQVRYTRGKDGNIDLCFTLGLTGRQAAPHFYGMYVVSSLRFNGNGFTVVVDPYLTSVGYGDLIDFLPGEGVYLYEDAGGLILQDGDTIGPVAYVNDINDSHPGYFDLSAVTITRREMRNDWEGEPLYVTIMLELPESSGGGYPVLRWVEEKQCWDLAPVRVPGPLADLPGELVTPSTLPSDPKEFYLVGRLGTIALYARDHGEQTLLVQEGSFWQLYDHRAHTSHLNLPKLTMLRDHYLAVVSEVGTGTQTGVDQLVVYDMNWDEPDENGMIIQLFESYTYDWRTVAAQFNRNNTLVYDKETNSFTVTYGGRTYNTGTLSTDMSRTLDLEDSFTGAAIASGQVVRYQFNEDDTITIAMQTCVGGGGDGYFPDDLMDIWKWNGEENYYNGMTMGVNGIELTWTIDFYHGQFHVDPFSIGLKV